MTKKLSKWDRELQERKTKRAVLLVRVEEQITALAKLAEDMRKAGEAKNRVNIQSMALTLVESAHYSMRKLRSGNYIR